MIANKMCDKCNVKMNEGSKKVPGAWGNSYMKKVYVCPKCGKTENRELIRGGW
jgi:hypothetical protein